MTKKTQIVFITGTGTGVGKTVVTAALMAALQDRSVRCLPAKPVQTGSGQDDDIRWCLQYSNDSISHDDRQHLNLYRFPLPASPHLAAKDAGEEIAVDKITAWINGLASRCDVLIVEGAGGLLVPLNEKSTMLDLILELDAAPVLVTSSLLGTLNHTALSLRELKRNDSAPAAVVINNLMPLTHTQDERIRKDNRDQIHVLADGIPVFEIDFNRNITRASLSKSGTPLAEALFPKTE